MGIIKAPSPGAYRRRSNHSEGQTSRPEREAQITSNMNTYIVTFEDIFSFSTDKRTVNLSIPEYEKAVQQMKNKDIVVNKLINGIRTQLIIKNIEMLFIPNQQGG